ncbi:hypothetical protein LNP05_19945 [Klebsiella pneumoniae subsp. pneumoniae]|nr:hypothetical protein [Klebsiella pneumoniae subsp. pneumoniae]
MSPRLSGVRRSRHLPDTQSGRTALLLGVVDARGLELVWRWGKALDAETTSINPEPAARHVVGPK